MTLCLYRRGFIVGDFNIYYLTEKIISEIIQGDSDTEGTSLEINQDDSDSDTEDTILIPETGEKTPFA